MIPHDGHTDKWKCQLMQLNQDLLKKNEQLQATTKKSPGKRFALDLQLLYENRVCGHLNLNNTCVHVSNVTAKLDDRGLKPVAVSSRELSTGLEKGWLNKTLKELGSSLTD